MQVGSLKVKDETIEDTMLDFANYCLLMAGYLRSKKKEPDIIPLTGSLIESIAVQAEKLYGDDIAGVRIGLKRTHRVCGQKCPECGSPIISNSRGFECGDGNCNYVDTARGVEPEFA